ncbi:HpcH/HpaI aldolase/citrate lyase family protein [Nocardia sp. NPDC004123]
MPQTVSVPAIHARSWLLVPGSRPDRFDGAMNSAADAVIFDLEDGVIPSAKVAAREHVTEYLATGGVGWVRINDATTADWSIDLAALGNAAGLSGVMLAMTESAEQVDRTAAELPGVPVLALVESARGIEFAFEIASADATIRLAFGTCERSDFPPAGPVGGLPVRGPTVATDPGPITRQPGTAPSAGCGHAVTHIRTIRPSWHGGIWGRCLRDSPMFCL